MHINVVYNTISCKIFKTYNKKKVDIIDFYIIIYYYYSYRKLATNTYHTLYTPGSWREGNLNLSIIFEVILTDVDSLFFNKQFVMVGKI